MAKATSGISRRTLTAGAATLMTAGVSAAHAQGPDAPKVKYKPNPPPVKITLPKMTRG